MTEENWTSLFPRHCALHKGNIVSEHFFPPLHRLKRNESIVLGAVVWSEVLFLNTNGFVQEYLMIIPIGKISVHG